jgi:hypothetical protein
MTMSTSSSDPTVVAEQLSGRMSAIRSAMLSGIAALALSVVINLLPLLVP